ncbi:MAG: hypothetical protein ABJD07_09200 [Gemmatimonadaceae bacterium]
MTAGALPSRTAFSDVLRPPWPADPSAAAYKDWLHLNVFDHATGSVGLLNVSLHGAPDDRRARAAGSALFHVPGTGWVGSLDITGIADARVGLASIALERVAIAADGSDGTIHASVRMPDDALRASIVATPAGRAIDLQRQFPFGSGWISWFLVPRLSLRGQIEAAGRSLDMATATAYHDHNWGRWHWGDDLGWDWGTFSAPAPGPTIVIGRTTDRDHRTAGPWSMVVDTGGTRRFFSGEAVSVTTTGVMPPPQRRLPGALAALHGDDRAPRLAEFVRVCGSDGIDHVDVEFRARASAQIITADPMRRGFGFINQRVGAFSAALSIGGAHSEASGLAVVEFVD